MASDDCSSVHVFRRYDDGFVVRRMTSDDVATVERWYSGICPTSIDLTIAYQTSKEISNFENDRFLVADLNGQTIASKVELNVGGKIAYGSLFYVEEQMRMFGYGRRINDLASETSNKHGFVVGIDAHDELEQMNIRRGYRTAFKVTQYQGKVTDHHAVGANSTSVLEIDDSLFDDVIDYDNRCFVTAGSQWRRRFLTHWIAIPGGRAVVAVKNENGHPIVVGFACRRPAKLHEADHLIGPLYADTLDVARDLMTSLTRDIVGKTVWINICDVNTEALRLVTELNLAESIHMLRMYRNESALQKETDTVSQLVPNNRVFAITSIDVCGY